MPGPRRSEVSTALAPYSHHDIAPTRHLAELFDFIEDVLAWVNGRSDDEHEKPRGASG